MRHILKLMKVYPKTKSLLWFVVFALSSFCAYEWKQHIFTAWVIVPSLLSLLSLNQWLYVQGQHRKLKRIDQIQFSDQFWQRMHELYPYLTMPQYGLITEGFKDYLALHVLQKQAYAMPSQAVDALWHVMLEYPDRYQKLCLDSIGRVINHHPYAQDTEQCDVEKKQLLNTWAYSCKLHDFNAVQVQQLPRLFAIDAVLGWHGGNIYDAADMMKEYKQYLKNHNSSSSCGSSCSSCGGD